MSVDSQELIQICLDSQVLLFGSFTLKSGRQSPYFFNAGLLFQGSHLAALAAAYAKMIEQAGLDFDVVFGPAYKGIALAAITVAELSRVYRRPNVGFAYNRKEAKAHGEGGMLVGAPLKGRRVLILDDVITAGTAIRESIEIIKREGGTLVGIAEVLDRQERGKDSPQSAVQQIERETGVPVLAVMTLQEIIRFLESRGDMADELKAMQACAWRSLFGGFAEEIFARADRKEYGVV
jgi:orotate phosphoribosyltransferase